jgi:hypothetical protein
VDKLITFIGIESFGPTKRTRHTGKLNSIWRNQSRYLRPRQFTLVPQSHLPILLLQIKAAPLGQGMALQLLRGDAPFPLGVYGTCTISAEVS